MICVNFERTLLGELKFILLRTLGDGGISSASWKVRRPFATIIFVALLSRESRRWSLDNLVVVSPDSSSSSWSNRPPEIFIRLLKITSMVVAYIFDMQSPGITKDSLLVTNRQACNMAMIAFWEKGEFSYQGSEITSCTYRSIHLFQWADGQV